MHYKKFEFKIPVFFGSLGALVFCALLVVHWPAVRNIGADNRDSFYEEADDNSTAADNTHILARIRPQNRDHILEMYRQGETHGYVVDFFTEICPSREISTSILLHAEMFNISPALAFALAWEESRLNPLAVNNKNRDGSIDRGLFQLNNRSFPRLEVQAFFNPELNAFYGMSHLRYCLDTGGTEIAALAMYNAGTGRVRNSGTPKTTLDYISRILENRREIESHFLEREIEFRQQSGGLPGISDTETERSRLVPLMPLGIR